MKYSITIHMLCFILLLCSCGNSTKSTWQQEGDTILMRHAHYVQAVKHGNWVTLDIRNPWDTNISLRSISVKVPVKRAAVYTATHAALLAEMEQLHRIGGVFDTQYIQHQGVRDAIVKGSIRDLGNSNAVNMEQIMDLQPDLLMPSPYESQGGYGRLEQMGIPIMECADYMEVSPLARAEWIRIYGLLFGAEHIADSLFNSIEKRYIELKDLASQAEHKPKLLTERPLSGTWHVPCGGSTTGTLYHDAGADYLFAHTPGSGANALSIEMVLDKAIDADFWLIKSFGPLTKEQLEQDCPALKHIKAKLMVCDTGQVPFFEETPFHPEYLLENLISLFHPELGIKAERNYFETKDGEQGMERQKH